MAALVALLAAALAVLRRREPEPAFFREATGRLESTFGTRERQRPVTTPVGTSLAGDGRGTGEALRTA